MPQSSNKPDSDIANTHWVHLWSPPPDPDKPACPYHIGFIADIYTHSPPPPFGHRLYGPDPWPTVTDSWLRTVTQTTLVMKCPPTETLPHPSPATAQLAITEPLAAGDDRGAQLVVCTITPRQPGWEPFEAVAKIFDPLYYSFANTFVPSVPANVAWMADVDYSREAAAYEHLKRVGQTGKFAPEYYGSWTFTLAIWHGGVPCQRPIRLVLMERIKGPTMREFFLAPGGPQYDNEYRLEILAQILDGVVRQMHAGLEQRDLAPRNIVLSPEAKSETWPRIVLIDYNISLVNEQTLMGKKRYQIEKLPPNPVEYFWGGTLRSEFEGWVPAEWDSDPRLVKEWLLRRFMGDVASEYAPIKNELTF